MRTKCRVEKGSIVHQLPEEKLWRSREARRSLPVVQLCSKCAHSLPQNLVDLKKKKPLCESVITYGSIMVVLPQSPLPVKALHRQTRY